MAGAKIQVRNHKTTLSRKKYKKKNLHSTPGSSKVLRCQATPLQKWACKRNRSYKDKLYTGIMTALDKKGKSSATRAS